MSGEAAGAAADERDSATTGNAKGKVGGGDNNGASGEYCEANRAGSQTSGYGNGGAIFMSNQVTDVTLLAKTPGLTLSRWGC